VHFDVIASVPVSPFFNAFAERAARRAVAHHPVFKLIQTFGDQSNGRAEAEQLVIELISSFFSLPLRTML